jgi:hypothetical protein
MAKDKKTKAIVKKPIAMSTGVITGNTNASIDYFIDQQNEKPCQ